MDDFNKPKIVYPETTNGAYFAFDNLEYLVDKTCFMLIANEYNDYLQLTLSSKLFEFAYKHLFASVNLGTDGYQYNKHALIKLPIIKPYRLIQLNINDLDKTIYKLYDISIQEIEYIERLI